MEDQKVQESGAPTSKSGTQTSEQKPEETKQEKEDLNRVVKFDDHKRALDDMHKYKKKVQEYEERLGQIESQRLKEKEDFKTLAEMREKERDEYREKYESLNDSLISNKKYDAVHSAALKLGLRSEAEGDLGLLNLNEVNVEYTSEGRMLVHGVDEYVQNLKKTKPHWFKDTSVPNFNGGGATEKPNGNTVLTPQEFVRLERQYKMKGDKTKLAELYNRFQKQRAQT